MTGRRFDARPARANRQWSRGKLLPWRLPARKSRGFFMPEVRARLTMAGRRVPAMPRGCPRQLSNAPATRVAVESLSRGACNATLEADYGHVRL